MLELAFFAEPPSRYLHPSTSGEPAWGGEPHYFSVYRSGSGATGAALFTAGAEIARNMGSGARVTVSSKDRFVHAAGTWPERAKAAPSSPALRRWLIAAGLLLAIGMAGGGYEFYSIEQQRQQIEQQQQQQQRDAERQALLRGLQAAGYDRGKIERLLASCGASCPAEVRTQGQKQLDAIAAETRTYQDAQNDYDRLRAYVSSCHACIFKSDAEQQIQRLDRQRQDEAVRRLAAKLNQAGDDLNALQRFVDECGTTCPPNLVAEAAARINRVKQQQAAARLEAQTYQAARGDPQKLQAYLNSCSICSFADVARTEISSLQQRPTAQTQNHQEDRASEAEADHGPYRSAAPPAQPPGNLLPQNTDLNDELLHLVATHPFFAQSPPIVVNAYSVDFTNKSTSGGTMITTNGKSNSTVTALGGGLSRFAIDTRSTGTSKIGQSLSHSQSVLNSMGISAGNGLFDFNYSMSFQTNGRTYRSQIKLLRIERMQGHIFPVEINNQFSFEATYEAGERREKYTQDNDCKISREFDAKSFHQDLTGSAFLVICDARATYEIDKSKNTTSQFKKIFFPALGYWIDADPVSPRERVVQNGTIVSTDKPVLDITGARILKSFSPPDR